MPAKDTVVIPPPPNISLNEGDLTLKLYRSALRSSPPRWVAPRTLWGSLGDKVAISVVCDDIAKLRGGMTAAQLLAAHLAELASVTPQDQLSWQEYTDDLAAHVLQNPLPKTDVIVGPG